MSIIPFLLMVLLLGFIGVMDYLFIAVIRIILSVQNYLHKMKR